MGVYALPRAHQLVALKARLRGSKEARPGVCSDPKLLAQLSYSRRICAHRLLEPRVELDVPYFLVEGTGASDAVEKGLKCVARIAKALDFELEASNRFLWRSAVQ